MHVHSKIGQLFFIGIEGTEETAELRSFLEEIRPGGIVLFARNILDPSQTRALCAFLTRSVDPPPFISIDQEGGRVNRLSGLVGELPPAATIAGRLPAGAVRDYAAQTGRALKALGFNMDFAPCVDLSRPGASNGIGDRSFGEDPETVARRGEEFVGGLQSEGIAAVLKHFPGLGSTEADTHERMPTCAKPEGALWDEDLLPFRRLAPHAAAVMLAHAHYSSLDPDRRIAASLSGSVVGKLLRGRMGYGSVAITDDLEMGAVCQEMTPDGLAVFALLVGGDMVMFCKSRTRIRNAWRGTLKAIHAGRLSRERVDESLGRILALKGRLGLKPVDPSPPGEEFETARAALLRTAAELAG